MGIGFLKWYGGFNSRTETYNEYGFLYDLQAKEDIYFHKKDIYALSELQQLDSAEGCHEELLLTYKVITDRRGSKAVDVMLLEESDSPEVEQQACELSDNPKLAKKLRFILPQKYLGKNMQEYFPLLAHRKVKALLQKRYRDGYFNRSYTSELITYLEEYFNDFKEYFIEGIQWEEEPLEEVVALGRTLQEKYSASWEKPLIKICLGCRGLWQALPKNVQEVCKKYVFKEQASFTAEEVTALQRLCFGKKIQEYFPYLAFPQVEEFFYQRYEEGYFQENIFAVMEEYLQADPQAPLSLRFLQRFNLQQENLELIQRICRLLGEAGRSIGQFYQQLHSLIDLLPQYMLAEDMEGLCRSAYVPTYTTFKLLCAEARDAGVAEILSQYVPLDYLLKNLHNFGAYAEAKRLAILSKIDWHRTDAEYLEYYRPLFADLEADTFQAEALQLCRTMLEEGVLFDKSWWQLLTQSLKLRMLLFSSNFPDQYASFAKAFKENIVPLEKVEVGKGSLVYATLFFYAIIFQQTDAQKQKKFNLGHDFLCRGIIDIYNEKSMAKKRSGEHGLRILLESCFGYEGGKMFFCDGRTWNMGDYQGKSVYCPERPGGGRSKCRYRQSLAETQYSQTRNLSQQHLTDLLLKGAFKLDCREISRTKLELYEYASKVASFVNRIIDMQPRLYCSHCHAMFKADFTYAKKLEAKLSATVFNCSQADTEGEHDRDVYLNYCYHCNRIIDSRECKQQDERKYYLCMSCGGGSSFTKPGTVCPNCGETNPDKLEYLQSKWISCKTCGHSGLRFYQDTH